MSPESASKAALIGPPDVMGVLRRQWPVIALCGLVAATIAYLYVDSSKVTYESKSTILLEALPGEVAPGGGRERTIDVETQATVARSTELLQRVGTLLDLTAVEVKKASRVEAAPTGDVLYLYFEDDDAVFAANGALAYTEEFLAQRKANADATAERERGLVQNKIDVLQNEVAELTTQIDAELSRGDLGSSTELTVLQQRQSLAIRDIATAREEIASIDTDLTAGRVVVDPRTSVSRTGLSASLAVGGGGALGLIIGCMIGLLINRRDDRYGSAQGLESYGVQEVGRLPYPGPLGGNQRPARREYARLLARLAFASGTQQSSHRAILIVAVESDTLPPGAMAAVAGALAAEGPDNGLVTTIMAVEGATPVEGSVAAKPARHRFAPSFADEMGDYDLALVAAQPLDRSAAGLTVASRADQTVLLISDSTRVNELVTVIEELESVNARDIGVVVLTRVPPRRRW